MASTSHKAELSVIERGFRRDPALLCRLLQHINSPGLGISREIRSIALALIVLGCEPLYRWLTLLLFAAAKSRPAQCRMEPADVNSAQVQALLWAEDLI